MAVAKAPWRKALAEAWKIQGKARKSIWDKAWRVALAWAPFYVVVQFIVELLRLAIKGKAGLTVAHLIMAGVYLLYALPWLVSGPGLLLAFDAKSRSSQEKHQFRERARWLLISTAVTSVCIVFGIMMAFIGVGGVLASLFSRHIFILFMVTGIFFSLAVISFLFPIRCYSGNGLMADVRSSFRFGKEYYASYILISFPYLLSMMAIRWVDSLLVPAAEASALALQVAFAALCLFLMNTFLNFLATSTCFYIFHHWIRKRLPGTSSVK